MKRYYKDYKDYNWIAQWLATMREDDMQLTENILQLHFPRKLLFISTKIRSRKKNSRTLYILHTSFVRPEDQVHVVLSWQFSILISEDPSNVNTNKRIPFLF